MYMHQYKSAHACLCFIDVRFLHIFPAVTWFFAVLSHKAQIQSGANQKEKLKFAFSLNH